MFSQIKEQAVTVNQGIEAPVTADQDQKLADIVAEQEAIFVRRQPGSARLARSAQGALAGGVVSSWQITAPQPVWLSHGQGSKVYDVDGQAYVDLHGGYGASPAGDGRPAPPGIRPGRAGQGGRGPPLRPADRERHRRGRGTTPPVRPAPVALRQL